MRSSPPDERRPRECAPEPDEHRLEGERHGDLELLRVPPGRAEDLAGALGVLEALEELGHPVTRMEPFDSRLGHAHAIELVRGGPAADGGSLAAATDPRSAGLPAAR